MTRSSYRFLVTALCMTGLVRTAGAQTSDAERVRLTLSYRAGVRPGIMVLSGPGLDGIRAVINNDLIDCDCYEVTPIPDSLTHLAGAFSAADYKGTSMEWAVELQPAGSDIEVRLHNLKSGEVVKQHRYPVDRAAAGDSRLAIHQISDHIVTWGTNRVGIAASRIAFVQDPPRVQDGSAESGIFRIDADGQNRVRVSPRGVRAVMPAWSADASRVAYTDMSNTANFPIWVVTLASGNKVVVSTTGQYQNQNATFSLDGKMMAFSKSGDDDRGGEIWTANTSNIGSICCAARKTVSGRNAENFAPAISPDGQRIAFERSFAGGRTEVWVMDADGTSQARLFSFEGNAHQPNWSPDGTRVAFDGEIGRGVPQVYYYDLVTQRIVPVTSNDRNENASWAPDSRHLVFRRTSEGRVRLVIWDTESKESRMLDTPAGQQARYPSWSPSLAGIIP